MTRAHRCLVLGGARSGKSSWAEDRLRGGPARYLATGYPAGDAEWQARLERHRARRPDGWETLESLNVAAALAAVDDRPLLVDCLTLWLTRTLDDLGAWELPPAEAMAAVRPRMAQLAAAVGQARSEVVLVSNEVGSGVVPQTASGRIFADLLGDLNRRVAQQCDEVVLMVAGIAVPVRGSAPAWRTEQG